jgi:hypothetical protein
VTVTPSPFEIAKEGGPWAVEMEVELRGLEPLTSSLPATRSSS